MQTDVLLQIDHTAKGARHNGMLFVLLEVFLRQIQSQQTGRIVQNGIGIRLLHGKVDQLTAFQRDPVGIGKHAVLRQQINVFGKSASLQAFQILLYAGLIHQLVIVSGPEVAPEVRKPSLGGTVALVNMSGHQKHEFTGPQRVVHIVLRDVEGTLDSGQQNEKIQISPGVPEAVAVDQIAGLKKGKRFAAGRLKA